MIKQKEITFNVQQQETVILSSIFVQTYEFEGKKTAKATIKAIDLDRQIDFGKEFPIQITDEETGEVKDIYFDVRFTDNSDFKLKNTMKKGYYVLKSNNIWLDLRPNNEGKERYILRVGQVEEFKNYYEVKQ